MRQIFFTNPSNIQSRIICYNTNGISDGFRIKELIDYNNKITDIIGMSAIADFNQDGVQRSV
ncbi:MAG: hypothetical protein IPL31_04500 [Saprospiraceae bacterium]|nr:hypothetical protein [Saprospiraceae bacterium]